MQMERGLSGWSDGLALEKRPPCRLGPPPRWCEPGGWSLWVRAVEGVQGTSGWSLSPGLPPGRLLSLPHPLWAGWRRLLPSLVGCEAKDKEYWVARLQEGRGGPVNPGVPPRSPAPWEQDQLGEPRARGERSQQIRER